jgi:PAS domain S-box-containing protein
MNSRQLLYFVGLAVIGAATLAVAWAYFSTVEAITALAAAFFAFAFLRTRARNARIVQEPRDSEKRFRELAESLPEIVFEADAHGYLFFLNGQGRTVSGYTDEDLQRGIHASDLVIPEERELVGRNIGAVIAGGPTGYNEYTAQRKDGTTYPVLVHSSAVFRDGKFAGLRGTVIDITGRKRIEDALLRAKQDAELASRAKSEFLAAVSHELRTPLNAIIGFSEMIKAELFGPVGHSRYRGYVRDINESGQHLLSLINDILDLAKIESGKEELNVEPVIVEDCARSALMLVRQRAASRGVDLFLDLEDGLGILNADTRKLKQIFVNLLTNAIKFTEAGGTITLAARRDRDGDLVLEVRDTGIGMAPEDIPKALSPFGQVKKDPAHAQEGTGLGLPLTQALADQHGGTLTLTSAPGAGTTATVRLPAWRLEDMPTVLRRAG